MSSLNSDQGDVGREQGGSYQNLSARRPAKLAAVALANKTARIARAMLVRGEDYQALRRLAAAALTGLAIKE